MALPLTRFAVIAKAVHSLGMRMISKVSFALLMLIVLEASSYGNNDAPCPRAPSPAVVQGNLLGGAGVFSLGVFCVAVGNPLGLVPILVGSALATGTYGDMKDAKACEEKNLHEKKTAPREGSR